MSLVTLSIAEMRDGNSFITVVDGDGVNRVDGEVFEVTDGQSLVLNITAGMDGSVQRYLGWVKINGSAEFMSDPFIDWRGRDTLDFDAVDGIAAADLYVGTGVTTRTITTTISAPTTVEISAMAMIFVDGTWFGQYAVPIFTVDTYSVPDGWERKGYGAAYMSVNSEAFTASPTICRNFLGLFCRRPQSGVLTDFTYYISSLVVDDVVQVPNSPFPSSWYHYFGQHTDGTMGGRAVKKLLTVPSQDVIVEYQCQQFPLYQVQMYGQGYGHGFQHSGPTVIMPNEGGRRYTFGVMSGDPDLGNVWTYPRGGCMSAVAAMYLPASLVQSCTYLDRSNPTNLALYNRYIAGEIPLSAVPLTTGAHMPTVYYELSGAGFAYGFLGNLAFVMNPNTGVVEKYTFPPSNTDGISEGVAWNWTERNISYLFIHQNPYVGISDGIYLDGPDGPLAFLKVIHETIQGCTVMPPDGTIFPAGANIQVEVQDYYPKTITLFELQHLNRINDLTDVEDKSTMRDIGTGYYVAMKENVKGVFVEDQQEDLYISAVAETQQIEYEPGGPVTIQCTAGCDPAQTWDVSISPVISAGLTIDNAGLLTIDFPYSVSPGDYTITVGVTDGGHHVERDIPLEITNPPVFGNVWSPMWRCGSPVTALFVTASGRAIAVGGDTIYLSIDDGSTWSSRKTNAGYSSCRHENIFQDTGGTIYVLQYRSNNDFIVSTSTDDGMNWTTGASIANAWSRPIQTYNHGSGVFRMHNHNYGSAVEIKKSTDYGVTWAVETFYSGGLNYWWCDSMKNPATGTFVAMKGNTGGPVSFLRAVSTDPKTFVAATGSFVAPANPTGVFARSLTLDGNIIGAMEGTTEYICKSGDDGLTWTGRTAAQTGLSSVAYALFCQRHVVLAGLNNKVMRSIDNGDTFLNVSQGTLDGIGQCFAILPSGIILCGTSGTTTANIYRSTS